jgi:hypothetical protein
MRLPRPRFRPDPRTALELAVVWLVIALPLAVVLFLTGSRSTVVAGHDAEVSPTLDGYATLDLGPYIPNFRIPTGNRLGAAIDLGATDLNSYEALINRYAFIASQPEGQIAKVRGTLLDMAGDSLVLGGLVGLAGPGLVLLVGRRRWRELAHPLPPRTAAGALTLVVLIASTFVLVRDDSEPVVGVDSWQPLAEALPDVAIPDEAAAIEIESGLVSQGTRRLVESAVESYRKSLEFYQALVEKAPELADQLRQPEDGETVGLLVSDRHDNIGMDPVARAVADAAGATFLLDAGDDTSTGGSWEAFSLESLDRAFRDYDDRYAVAGNHDHGDFVAEQLDRLGFTTLEGEVVDGPEGIRLLGASDVRSSGLGSWRDERGVSFADQQNLLADLACEYDADGDRISTLLVHDANSGRIALERGCVDLVLAGHLHLQVGPTEVVGANGRTGYSYTNGTTGGAAYAVAIGSKLRRDAQVSLITYREGRPIGVQPVSVRTNGEFVVGEFVPLELDEP